MRPSLPPVLRRLTVLVSLTVFAPLASSAETAPAVETHPFSVQDLVTMERISDPQASPDGRWVAFVLRSTDLDADRGRTDLWRVAVDGNGLARLTTHEAGDFNPRWAADGASLYFLSTRSGSSQVWRLPLAGGEARQVTDLPLDAGNLVLSPDGRRLAVSMDVFVDCDTLACTTERLAAKEERKATGVIYDQLFLRHWDTWNDGRRSHLFVLELGEDGTAGEPVDVTRGLAADVPSKPFGGPEEITFTADGSGLVFAAKDVGREEAWSTNSDLFYAPADGSAAPRNLTAANPAWDTQPVFSPDGRTLAYLAMRRAGFEADRFRIVLRSWPDGAERVLTEAWDRSPGSLVFSADGGTIYATAADVGEVALFAVDTASGEVRRLVAGGHVRSPQVAGARLVFGRDTFTSPVELFTAAADGSDVERITGVNDARLAAVRLGEYEAFSFPGAGGDTVHGYVVKPADFEAGGQYPVAFLIHGGPQGSFGNDFHYRWNPQTYAGAGYAAVMVDFHGSTGYGQAFTDSISGDWGGKPLEDLQKGLAAALERFPWLDGGRVCALGASYGGYMINWIAGNWPDRFRCLVNHDGLFDHRMMYYATEELWFPESEHGGPYFANPEEHEKHNPVRFVENWKTPMLVVHGALDFRVPETQSFATFTALQRRGIPSRLLYFPDESHWVLKPSNSILWHETVNAWLDRWLHGDSGSPKEF
jgi:dipeptidyl aminopeptidase/acylaminoacyl peptidase